MSADDGVYIGMYKVDEVEVYSVVHGHMPNTLNNPKMFDRAFETGKLFLDKAQACLYAVELQSRVWSEYGVRMVEDFSSRPPKNVYQFKRQEEK